MIENLNSISEEQANLHIVENMDVNNNLVSCIVSSMIVIKKSHDKLDKVGKVNFKFVKFANFAMQIFNHSLRYSGIPLYRYTVSTSLHPLVIS